MLVSYFYVSMELTVLPAFHGDCLLCSFDTVDGRKHILIDGGVSRTYRHALRLQLQRIAELGQCIDLLIITHIDDDHIGGIIALYQDPAFDKSIIKKVWFNAGNLLSDYFQNQREPTREVPIIMDDTINMSMVQSMTLEASLNRHGHWQQRLVMADASEMLSNAAITVLSPTERQLQVLHQKWETEKDSHKEMTGPVADDYNIPISELAGLPFIEDKAIANGSSIAILLETAGKRMLLLADSHPSAIVNSLQRMGFSQDRKLEVDLVKVSHHASKSNTSHELLSMIQCNRYVVSTNGYRHGLPDKQAIARIITANPGCKIYFNYCALPEKIFLPADRSNYSFQSLCLCETDYVVTI